MKNLIRGIIGFVTGFGAMAFAEASGIEQAWRRAVLVVFCYAIGLVIGIWIAIDSDGGK